MRNKGKTVAFYEFVGPDGKMYQRKTYSSHSEVAYAQFIHHPKRGWAFIGMESLVKYLAFEGMRKPGITYIQARKIKGPT